MHVQKIYQGMMQLKIVVFAAVALCAVMLLKLHGIANAMGLLQMTDEVVPGVGNVVDPPVETLMGRNTHQDDLITVTTKAPDKEFLIEANSTDQHRKTPIFFVWLGKLKMQNIHKAAIESCRKWNSDLFDVRVIDEKDMEDARNSLGFDLHPSFQLLDHVQKSDYLRGELLHAHGGYYLDTDVFCMRSLNHTLTALEGGVLGGGAPELIPPRVNLNNNMLGPFLKQTYYTKYWHDALMAKMDELTPKLLACAKKYPDGHGGIDYLGQVRYITVHQQPCGMKWGELIDFVKDTSLQFYRNRTLKRMTKACPNAHQISDCDFLHLNCGGSPDCLKSLCHEIHMKGSGVCSDKSLVE